MNKIGNRLYMLYTRKPTGLYVYMYFKTKAEREKNTVSNNNNNNAIYIAHVSTLQSAQGAY